ncbi:hypothetical protein PRK78_005874 [Emydomyces testavorans]|uniref:C3H1-type domain-containing protein n=1 Tax=Emydomyces testavorans TaxID=2070801 RepID=A0AAF0IN16_9EURO|nr:hypothetical protein PRK78_005874 [Emydomyces testavorans]
MQPQPAPLQDLRNPPLPAHLSQGGPRPPNRMANDPRGRAPLPVPSRSHLQNGQPRSVPSFDMARSPPNPPPSKNTKHVPCKFFRQGTCQAGPACPFLHSTDSAVDSAPCKYFTKGNCKFGAKCALAHILPDGRRVNRPNIGMGMGGGGNLNLGGRVNYPPYHPQDSALANSLLSQQQQQQQQQMNGHGSRVYPYQDDMQMMHGQPQPPIQTQSLYENIPIIDTNLMSDTGSKYGSPPEDGRHTMSPIGRSALDAPLPASFDSQGISYIARHGPVASSVPSRFGFDLSPTPSNRPDMFRNLHEHTFGSDLKKFSTLSSSPILSGDEASTARVMHSQRVSRPKMLSASLPRPTVLDDWDDNFAMEEDYLPTNLHDDVLTPQEKMRRLSRTENDSHGGRDLTGLGLPLAGPTKVGSPLASSPSRFGALFAKQRQKKEEESQSALGHVGSPLRDSSLSRSSPGLRPIGSRPSSGDISPFIASSARQASMSMITQQLSSTSLHPNSARHAPTGARLDRTITSPVSTSRIDEEQGDLVFSMEEEENKRNNSAWAVNKPVSTEGSNTSREPVTPTTATTPKDIVYKKRA